MDKSFRGTIVHKGELKSGTSQKGGTWQTQDLVVCDEGSEYKETGSFKVYGDKLKHYKVGMVVDVYFNLKSREYQGKWYNELVAWKIEQPMIDNRKPIVADDVKVDTDFNEVQSADLEDYSLPF